MDESRLAMYLVIVEVGDWYIEGNYTILFLHILRFSVIRFFKKVNEKLGSRNSKGWNILEKTADERRERMLA